MLFLDAFELKFHKPFSLHTYGFHNAHLPFLKISHIAHPLGCAILILKINNFTRCHTSYPIHPLNQNQFIQMFKVSTILLDPTSTH